MTSSFTCPRLLNAEPDGYSPRAKSILESFAAVTERGLAQSELEKQVGDFELLIVRLGLRVNRPVLDAGGRLQAIVSATTGLDHIDLHAARDRGIAVLSLRGERDFLRTVPASSEHTWALLLSLSRRLPAAFDAVRRGEWDRGSYRGHDLRGKRLGIVGLGRIGERVARYALAFGMSVIAFDPAFEGAWPGEVEAAGSLEELLPQSDVLSLHVTLDDRTRGLIGDDQLARLPAGALLVNTSRGEVVDETALLAALKDGRLGGAALDVLAGEPFTDLTEHPVVRYAHAHPNLVLTPHLAGATWESMEKTELFMAEKLKRWWISGRPGIPFVRVTSEL